MEQVVTHTQGLPASAIGRELRAAREASGLSLGDVAARTKIAERYLLAIEEDRFVDLASRTYAIGFARAFARTVGLGETETAQRVRDQLDAQRPVSVPEPTFEPGDPARVPSRTLTVFAVIAILLVVGVGMVFWGSLFSPQGKLPDLLTDAEPAPVPAATPAATLVVPSPAVAASGPVVLTALDDNVWIQVKSEDGQKLIERILKKDESWAVPADAKGPKLRIGRANALRIAVGGRVMPPLADGPVIVSNVSLNAADLIAGAENPDRPAAPLPSGAASNPATGVVASAVVPVRRTSPRSSSVSAVRKPAAPAAAAAATSTTASARQEPEMVSSPVVQAVPQSPETN